MYSAHTNESSVRVSSRGDSGTPDRAPSSARSGGRPRSGGVSLHKKSAMTCFKASMVVPALLAIALLIPATPAMGHLTAAARESVDRATTVTSVTTGATESDSAALVMLNGEPTCDWDFDGNNNVGFEDLLTLLAHWNNPFIFGHLIQLLAAWGAC